MDVKENFINEVLLSMNTVLDTAHLELLKINLSKALDGLDLVDAKQLPSCDLANNQKLIEMFLVSKKIEGLTDNTLEAYYYSLKRFDRFINCSFLELDSNCIRLFLYEIGKNCSDVSVNNMRANLNAFYRWLSTEGYIKNNPFDKISKIKADKVIKEPLSKAEVVRIKDACINSREIALVDLMLSTGVRVEEITKIKVSEVNFIKREILIHGKGKKERIVYMDEDCLKHLEDFLKERTYDSEYLFCRTRAPYGKISPDSIEATLKTIGDRCNVSNCTVHRFRKYFATTLFNRGCDLVYIQNLLGHSNINTTTIYVRADKSQIHHEFNKYS